MTNKQKELTKLLIDMNYNFTSVSFDGHIIFVKVFDVSKKEQNVVRDVLAVEICNAEIVSHRIELNNRYYFSKNQTKNIIKIINEFDKDKDKLKNYYSNTFLKNIRELENDTRI